MGLSMTETEFLDEVRKVWELIESQLDNWAEQHDLDLEVSRMGPVMEIEFETGRKMVVNPQTPMQQIWLASPRGAYHFQSVDGVWTDTRSAEDFWQVFAREASAEAGVSLVRA